MSKFTFADWVQLAQVVWQAALTVWAFIHHKQMNGVPNASSDR